MAGIGRSVDVDAPDAVPLRRRGQLRALHRPVPPAPPAPTLAPTPPPAGRPTRRRPSPDMLARQRHSAAVAARATTVSLAVGVLALVVRSMSPAPTAAEADTAALRAFETPMAEPATTVAPVALAASASEAAIVELPSEQAMSTAFHGDGFPVSGEVTDLLRTHFGAHAIEALVVAQCESSFRPDAVGTNTNGTQDHGLFQINDVHRRDFERVTGRPWSERYDPETNVEFAAWLFRRDGWGPWTCSRMLDATD